MWKPPGWSNKSCNLSGIGDKYETVEFKEKSSGENESLAQSQLLHLNQNKDLDGAWKSFVVEK